MRTRVLERLFGQFGRDQRGAAFVYVAVSLPVIIGFAGLGVDISMWQLEKRRAQDMADSGAIEAGSGALRSGDMTAIVADATTGAARNGFNTVAGDVITINNPPLTGPFSAAIFGDPDGDGISGDTNTVEVIVASPAPTFFSALIDNTQRIVSARAEVSVINQPGNMCMIALDPTGGITVSGGADVDLDCGAVTNGGTTLNGGACLSATQVQVVGTGDDNACSTDPVSTSPMPDPLRFLVPVTDRRCDENGNTVVTNGNTRHVYTSEIDGMFFFCGDVTVNNGGTLILHPGVYVFDGAGLAVSGELDATAGVMFYLTENASVSNNISINGGAVVEINPMWLADATKPAPFDEHSMDPPDDCWQGIGGIPPPVRPLRECSATAEALIPVYEGIAFFLDRDAPDGINFNFTGGADMHINGVVYLPGGDVTWAGGSTADVKAVIADNITVTGNADFSTVAGTILENLLRIVFFKLVG